MYAHILSKDEYDEVQLVLSPETSRSESYLMSVSISCFIVFSALHEVGLGFQGFDSRTCSRQARLRNPRNDPPPDTESDI